MLGDRAGIDALRAREADVPRFQRLAVESGRCRRSIDWMKLQLRRAIEQGVAPQAGDDHHVGVGDSLLEVGWRAHLDAFDAHLAEAEACLELIGRMGKADFEAVLRWQHGTPPFNDSHATAADGG